MAKAKSNVSEITPERKPMKMVRPRNEKQKYYMEILQDPSKSIVVATGMAGTSKSYIAAYDAARKISKSEIEKIYLVRPAVSASKSLGFWSGSLIEKATNWNKPVINALIEFLGAEKVDELLLTGAIELVPLEIAKGWTFKDCVTIVDESEDVTEAEYKILSTRVGENCTIVFAGDIRQIDLKSNSGLAFAHKLMKEHPDLFPSWASVDFDKKGEIERSKACRETVSAYLDLGLM